MRKRRKRTTDLQHFLGFLILCIVLSSCQPQQTTKPVDKIQLTSSVDSLLTQWHIAAAEANYDNYFNAMDSISIFIGTDYTENWTKSAFESFSKPYFDRGKAWSFSAIDRNIYSNDDGSIVWFDELLQTWMGICRGSGVVENKEGELKIKHYVLSVTVPNDKVSDFLELKPQELDSTFVKNLTFKK